MLPPGATLGRFVKDNPGSPDDYANTHAGRMIAATYAARTMRWTGIIVVLFILCVMGGRVIPMQVANLSVGILFVFALASLAVYGIALAGWSSNNKYSFLGAMRSAAQLISYELSMGLSLIGMMLVMGSLNITDIVQQQSAYWFGWLPQWNIFVQPIGFLLSLGIAMLTHILRDSATASTALLWPIDDHVFHLRYSFYLAILVAFTLVTTGIVALGARPLRE